ncbi:dimethyl sulfoxide reductase anchor subunit family protein [Alkalilimnicola ehrlichii MLHE-1]|uniref:DMSO reductase anchor subunit (DmsC) n=1 Tax=Alkalilimnicola ehrlichii (strain ATCC BAA-1101 / DSM 17681 / MLHE-1) TaxID=187272 RepID=Q0A814_ALKEH|nr:DmsC/YnfH family molybdoenzyme membrane anchor subunit [Alkalilimnicola ehrlichii]ABI57023.1 DMSO reductase anchor subunit (DmsC) [Alkalilimnicola ehrlichii MLHE-1]
MHPPLSVVGFTVLSGAGYGFIALFVIAAMLQLGGPVAGGELTAAAIIGFLLITVGLLLSTGHLANPRNAWRAFSRFRSSWLSREAVLAVLFYPVAALYLLGLLLGDGVSHGPVTGLLGVLTVILALGTVLATGMIYACLPTIRAWHSSLTPINYLLMGLALGGLLLVLVRGTGGADLTPVTALALLLLVLAGLGKLLHYDWQRRQAHRGPDAGSATGLTGGRVRLLDPGHTSGTFLTEEFIHGADEDGIRVLRRLVLMAGFVIPALMLLAMATSPALWPVALALPIAFAGVLLERWLFFVEARHVVRHYNVRTAV